MKKIDKLVLLNFLGPFILTTLVVVFIFLLRFLMLYFEDFVGKDLSLDVYAKLFVYFSLITVPISLPLSILLAALMSFGNLGEHTELTAMKSAGIPLVRIIRPTLVFSCFVAAFSFWYSDVVTPWANLKGYSLLYDIRTTKVALNIEEGVFYRQIPGYSIKAKKKLADGETLLDVIIYDHTGGNGNKNVTVADSGKMSLKYDDSYLVIELFDGYNYSENAASNTSMGGAPFVRNKFKKNRMVLSMESFGMQRTSEDQFKYHEFMKNMSELTETIDSTRSVIKKQSNSQIENLKHMGSFQFHPVRLQKTVDETTGDTVKVDIKPGPWVDKKVDVLKKQGREAEVIAMAKSNAQGFTNQIKTNFVIVKGLQKDMFKADIERWHKITFAIACLAMFIIGSSLGSIIKRGGFGMPVVIAISFFILYYVIMQLMDKNAKEGLIPVFIGVWVPDIILTLIGLFLLIKATKDASILESEFVSKAFEKLKIAYDKIFKPKAIAFQK